MVRARRGDSYSSPHLVTLDGVPQVLLLTSDGVTSVAPADGRVLWTHDWATASRIVQPALTAGGDILVGAGGFAGMQRVSATRAAGRHGGWTTEVRWTTRGLKPYFNDFVAHQGHAYGFDGSILASVDLETGERNWKGGRYGHGQLLLLADQDLLLVLGERGDLALVDATPAGFTERARVPVIEGKTWNHPVLVDDILLVRNTEEMAAFRLSNERTSRPSGSLNQEDPRHLVGGGGGRRWRRGVRPAPRRTPPGCGSRC